jgi:hypothetical protein|tara:strand:+ start:118 stop:258 length:141 start_codon:yes stop_codon:yes gene_type:complete
MLMSKFSLTTKRKLSEKPTHHQIILKMFKKKEILFLREEYGEGIGK